MSSSLLWWESTDELRIYLDKYRYELLRMRPIINCILEDYKQGQKLPEFKPSESQTERNSLYSVQYKDFIAS